MGNMPDVAAYLITPRLAKAAAVAGRQALWLRVNFRSWVYVQRYALKGGRKGDGFQLRQCFEDMNL